MSEEGYNKLLADLKQLETVERPKIVAAIAEARDKGDLSENAEYDAAKEAQGMLEMRINKLKQVIADAKIIDESKLKTDSVQILNKVELKNVKNGMKMTYTIVSESEANLKEGKISVNTPIAQGLLGKKVGDVAEIKVPQGMIKSGSSKHIVLKERQVHYAGLPCILYIYKVMATNIQQNYCSGEIPCYKVAENDKFFAFLDINPLVKGHTLVIPKREVDYIFDLSDEDLAAMHIFAKKVALAIGQGFPCKKVGEAVLGWKSLMHISI